MSFLKSLLPFDVFIVYTNIRIFEKSNSKNSMRKFIYHFILYIGVAFCLFNPGITLAETLPLFGEKIVYDKSKPLIEADNELVKFYVMLNLADKLFDGDKINGDLSGYLQRVWPTVQPEKLKKIEGFVRFYVSVKRRYVYATDRLRQQIKATALLPQEALVVAKDGEFAPKYSDKRKKTADGQYEVSYTPYKYLEYAPGEIGNPVRRRDKNFEDVSPGVIDEITLALLEFNIGKFYRALGKLPAYNDGTREKPVLLDDGVKARLLLDTAYPGDKPTIRGVIEVLVPKGYYINGDYLNPFAKPVFFLSEDSQENLNIKDYKLYAPVPSGVVIGKKAARVLTQNVLFPIEFTRNDYHKPMKIKGDFSFVLCQAKDATCKRVSSAHELTLHPSDDEQVSIHYDFVTKGFSALPKEESAHAKLKSALLNKANKTLELSFATTASFSNTAAMVEDKNNTSFLNPRYQIKEDEVSVVFDYDEEAFADKEDENEIAVTASFDDDEILRTVVTPRLSRPDFSTTPLDQQTTTAGLFWLGVWLSLMPGALCLLTKLCLVFAESPAPRRVFFRFFMALGVMLAGGIFYGKNYSFEGLYDNGFINAVALMIGTGLLMESAGYMNFALFRPLKKIFHTGLWGGIFTAVLVMAYPFLSLPEVLFKLRGASVGECVKVLTLLWGGMSVLALAGLIFNKKARALAIRLGGINGLLIILYLLLMLVMIFGLKGTTALIAAVGGVLLSALLWYVYPLVIGETTTLVRLKKDKIFLFDKVQKYALYAVCGVFLCFGFILNAFAVKPVTLPKLQSLQEKISQKIQNGKAVVLSIYDMKTLNRLFGLSLNKEMQRYGIEVLSYDTRLNAPDTIAWLNAYRQDGLPLHILFTNRHKEGLVLPQDLGHINWQNALKDFVLLPKEPINEAKERNNQQ